MEIVLLLIHILFLTLLENIVLITVLILKISIILKNYNVSHNVQEIMHNLKISHNLTNVIILVNITNLENINIVCKIVVEIINIIYLQIEINVYKIVKILLI